MAGSRQRVAVMMGTRPEVIKLAPVVAELQKQANLEVLVWVSGQHREMLRQAAAAFNLEPSLNLDIMRESQRLTDSMASVVDGAGRAIRASRPAAVLVQGDTITAVGTAIAAFLERTPVGHVEAGLRSGDPWSPFPEEGNRRLLSEVARWHFAPTDTARDALLAEGIAPQTIHVTGNTVVDACIAVAATEPPADFTARFGSSTSRRLILATVHRRENQGHRLVGICEAIAEIATRNPEVHIVLPVHPNPQVKHVVEDRLRGHPRIDLVEPLDYATVVHLLTRSYLVITDSGGLQEEAPTFGVPVLVMRTETERPEGVRAGTARLVGVERAGIVAAAQELLDDSRAHASMSCATSPYGDGTASQQIAQLMSESFELRLPEQH